MIVSHLSLNEISIVICVCVNLWSSYIRTNSDITLSRIYSICIYDNNIKLSNCEKIYQVVVSFWVNEVHAWVSAGETCANQNKLPRAWLALFLSFSLSRCSHSKDQSSCYCFYSPTDHHADCLNLNARISGNDHDYDDATPTSERVEIWQASRRVTQSHS